MAFSMLGTPEYVSPEIINEQPYNATADWWAVGVLIYEMLLGRSPFFSINMVRLQEKIRRGKISFPDPAKYNIKISAEIKDIICKLLLVDRTKRLGANGVDEIMQHPFFASIDFDALLRREITPPTEIRGVSSI